MALRGQQPIWVELGLKTAYVAGLGLNLASVHANSSNNGVIMRRITLPLCPIILAFLLLNWHRRLGWANVPYACCVLVGLVLNTLADVIMCEPRDDFLAYVGFAVYMAALFCFMAAFNLPTRGDASETGHHGVHERLLDAAAFRAGEKLRTAPPPSVSVKPARGLAPVVVIAVALLSWRLAGGADVEVDPRYAVTACLVIVEAILVWRALARVGYAAPLVTVEGLLRARRKRQAMLGITDDERFRPYESSTRRSLKFDVAGDDDDRDDYGHSAFSYMDDDDDDGEDTWGAATLGSLVVDRGRSGLSLKRGTRRVRQQRRERNQRLAQEEAAALESRAYQWCAVVGSIVLSLGLLTLGYDQFWEEDDLTTPGFANDEESWLTYAYTILAWVGQTLIAASVPCELPPVPGLDDDTVCPPLTEGAPLRIAIIIPEDDFDIAEVAVPWYVLTRRGHSVVVVTRDGLPGIQLTANLAVPLDVSAHGYGCAAAACGGDRAGCCGRAPVQQPAVSTDRESQRVRAAVARHRGSLCRRFCCCGGSNCSRSSPRCASLGLAVRRLLCCGDMCTAASVAVGVASPGPLVVAMYREMLESEPFRTPLAWSRTSLELSARRLPRRQRRRPPRRGRGSDASEAFGDASGVDAVSAILAENLFVPESVDGMLVVGAYPAAVHESIWSDDELQDTVARFWNTGRPLGAFGNAALVLGRTADATTGQSVLQNVMMTAMPAWMEWMHAILAAVLNCRWAACSLLCRRRRTQLDPPRSIQEELCEELGNRHKFVAGESPFTFSALLQAIVHNDGSLLRAPCAYDDSRALVVEDGSFITGQCGGDAFLLVRRFMSKLEEVQRTF